MEGKVIDHDDLIIQMLASDDDQAVKILFDQYYEFLSDVTFQLTNDRDTCDDLIQELFINIWLKRNTIRLRKPLSHYLIRAAINRAKNHRRNRNRSKEILTDNFKEFENNRKSIPSDSFLQEKDIKNLWAIAKTQMKPRTRIIFLLSRKQGMTYKEIAVHLGLSVKTVEKNLSVALSILRDVFKPFVSILLFSTFPFEWELLLCTPKPI